MTEPLIISDKEFIPASEAGRLVGYSSDYITKLARENKIDATRVGRQWFVTLSSVSAFATGMTEEKNKRNEEIKQERKLEQLQFSKNNLTASPVLSYPGDKILDVSENKRSALIQTFVIIVLGLSVGTSFYAVSKDWSSQAGYQTASVESRLSLLETLALSMFRFISPSSEQYVREPKPGQDLSLTGSADTSTTTYTSLVVAPDEIFTESRAASIRDAFSDIVSVAIDPLNPDTGIIIPEFRDREGEAYRFLMVPVTESNAESE